VVGAFVVLDFTLAVEAVVTAEIVVDFELALVLVPAVATPGIMADVAPVLKLVLRAVVVIIDVLSVGAAPEIDE